MREYIKQDKDKLKTIAESYFDEDGIEIIEQNNTVFVRTALYEQQVVGTVFAWESAFHSNCLYFRIFVAPSFQGEDIEKALLEVITEHAQHQNNDLLPLQTSIWETSVRLKKLYETNGFEELRRTYMPILQVKDALICTSFTLDHNIQTIAEVSQDKELTNKLVELVQRNYTKTHIDNPVSENIGQDVWEKLVFAEDLLVKGSYVYLEGGEILAYSFLHESDDENTFELGWCGASCDKNQEVIQTLVQRQVSYTKGQGVTNLLGEFDTTDEAAMSVLASFPFAPCPTWVTYSLKLQ